MFIHVVNFITEFETRQVYINTRISHVKSVHSQQLNLSQQHGWVAVIIGCGLWSLSLIQRLWD